MYSTYKPPNSSSTLDLPLSGNSQNLMFNAITKPTTLRPPKKKSVLVEHVEKDRKTIKKETEFVKSDPLKGLSPEEINELAFYALEMYQTSLKKCSSESSFEIFIRNIKRLGLGKFVDEAFPPNLKSLVGDNLINRSPWRAFVWQQPYEIAGEDFIIFKNDTPLPEHVQQGLIGDGYLMASLAALAETPQRVIKIFEKSLKNIAFGKEHGVFSVNLYLAGHPYELVLDDYYPCISQKQGACFAKCIDGNFWPMMIEKAWAKMYSSYDNIENGYSKDALRGLTGAPVRSLWTDENVEDLWQELVTARENKYTMTTATKKFNDKIDYINELGLISGHVYSCLGGFEVKTNQGNVRLIKVRTVYPEAIWQGKWSLESETKEWDSVPDKYKYTSELQSKPLVFYIDFKSFQEYFETVQFCYVNDDFKYSFQTTKVSRKKAQFYKIIIKEPGVYYFGASQDPYRLYPKSYRDQYQDLSFINLVIGRKVGESQYEWVTAAKKSDSQDIYAESTQALQPGEYIAYLKAEWVANEEQNVTFSVYGQGKAKIYEELDLMYKDFLETLFLDYAAKKGKMINLDKDGAPDSEYCAEKTLFGFGFIAIWNRESSKKLICDFRLKNTSDEKEKTVKGVAMKFKGKFNRKDVAEFTLLPRKSNICLVKVKKYAEYGDESNYKLYHSKNIKTVYK